MLSLVSCALAALLLAGAGGPAAAGEVDRQSAARARARVHKDRGDQFAKAGRSAQALKSYRGAIALDPEYVAAYRALGELLVDLERSGEAVRLYRVALRDNPSGPRLWQLLAFALRKAGQYDEALAAYRRYRQLNPADASAYFGIALTHRAMGDKVAAVGAFNTFLLKEMRPEQRAWLVEAR